MTTFEIVTLILGGLGVLLTGVYVILTLRIANKTAESVKATQDSLVLAREQLEINKQQSKEAATLSEKQAQATLAVAREQIEQNKQPILIPLSALPLTQAGGGELEYTQSELPLELMNVGTGVALNIWGVLVPPKYITRIPYS